MFARHTGPLWSFNLKIDSERFILSTNALGRGMTGWLCTLLRQFMAFPFRRKRISWQYLEITDTEDQTFMEQMPCKMLFQKSREQKISLKKCHTG